MSASRPDPYVPRVWVDKEAPSIDELNLYLRDYSDFLLQAPMCKVHATAAQSVANAAWAQLTFGAEDFDNDAMWDAAGTINIHTAGWYTGNASVCYAAGQANNNVGYRWITLYSSRHSLDINAVGEWGDASGDVKRLGIPFGPIYLDKGNSITVRVYQSSGAALLTTATTLEFSSDFYCRWTGPA